MDKYLNYSIEELAVEETFINWVKQSNSKDFQFWESWRKSNPEKEELIAQAKLLVEKIKFKENEVSKDREDFVWNKINASTSTKQISNSRKIIKWMIAAAAILLPIVFVLSGPASKTQISTSLTQIKEISLPGGSIVDLNSHSEINYDKKSFQKIRELELKGEAFFNVVKGTTFKVITDNGVVEVLGTSFNVFSRRNELRVSCESGKVVVRTNGEESILEANERVEITGKRGHIKEVDVQGNRSDWRKGIYHYKGKELSRIIKDMERHLDVDVDLQGEIDTMKFSGSFNSTNLETALSEVCWPLGLVYNIEGKKVKISKK